MTSVSNKGNPKLADGDSKAGEDHVVVTANERAGKSETNGEKGQKRSGSKKLTIAKALVVVPLTLMALMAISAMVLSAFEFATPFLDPLVQYRLQIAAILAILTGTFCALRKMRWAMVCLLVALPTIISAAMLYLPVNNKILGDSEQSPRKILFVNIFQYHNSDMEAFVDLIEQEKPDVVCMVEYIRRLNKQKMAILEERFPYVCRDPHSPWGGAIVLSKYPLEQEQDRMYAPHIRQTTVVLCEVMFPERTTKLLVTHPNSPTARERIYSRNRQLDDLAQIVNEQSGPIICCGDFNCTTWSRHLNDFIRATGLHDSRQGFGLQPSWPAYGFAFLAKIPIDHLFHSDEIEITNHRIGKFVGSDHSPVIVEFKLQSADQDSKPRRAD